MHISPDITVCWTSFNHTNIEVAGEAFDDNGHEWTWAAIPLCDGWWINTWNKGVFMSFKGATMNLGLEIKAAIKAAQRKAAQRGEPEDVEGAE